MIEIKKQNVSYLRIIRLADSSIFLWPVVILYYYYVSGSATGAGVLLATRSIASTVAELPMGVFSDHFGRARTTQAATTLYLLSAIMTVGAWWIGFWLLCTAVIVQGIAEASESGNHDSLLYESSLSENEYKITSAHFETIGSTAGMVSAVIGGLLGAKSLLIVAGVSVLPRMVSFVASLRVRDVTSRNPSDSRTIKASFGELWATLVRDIQVRYALTGRVLAEGFGEVSWQFRALFVQTVWPTWALGLSMPISLSANALGGVLYSKYEHKLRRYKELNVVLASTLIGRLLIVIALAIQNVFSPVLIGLAGLGGPVNRVSFGNYLHSKLHDGIRASGFSVLSLVTTLLFSVVSVGFGVLIDDIGVQKSLIIATLCTLTSTLFYALATRTETTKSNL
jgi:MFS family permease